MKPKIVLSYPTHLGAINDVLKPNARFKVTRSRAELKRALRDADGLITLLTEAVDEDLLKNAKKLKVIGNNAVGVDNIDLKYCQKRKIKVVNTPKVLTRATAELTLTLLLAAARRVPEGEALCRKNAFKGWVPDLLLGQELYGRQAIIVGKGKIGKETGKLFRGIGLKVDYVTSQQTEAQIKQRLKKAQILSLHIPLNPKTHHWLSKKRLSYLPSDSIVLNTTRGPTVDEKALISALKQKRIFAAGLDVFENEPEIPAALRRLPNVVLLPHVGSATEKTRYKMAETAIRGVLEVLRGKRPWNLVKIKS